MTQWARIDHHGSATYARLAGDRLHLIQGSPFASHRETGTVVAATEARFLTPCEPRKLIGLWNNFRARAAKEGWDEPAHPLWFTKNPNCYLAHKDTIRRPAGCIGDIGFEAELGIVIGRRCDNVDIDKAADYVLGYTCVNDVTNKTVLNADASFRQWGRAKSFDSFGPFGPVIDTVVDPQELRVQGLLNGELLQDYPVADMFFSPLEIVARLSMDMTLEAGDVIACGTSLGAGLLKDGDRIVIRIEGVGELDNAVRF